MIVEHHAKGINETLTSDYSKYFDKTWLDCDDMEILLKSHYMSNLNFYISETFKGCSHTYPRLRNHLYKAFKLTPLHNIRVVIFADEPFANVYSNGLAFGQIVSPSAVKPKEVITLTKAVEKTYFDSKSIVFDTSLEDWSRQGVFLLNTSLISEFGTSNKHRKAFKNFTRQIIKIISSELTDVVFVFTNPKQEEIFGKYIEQTYHHIITIDGITENTEVFDEINSLLLLQDGTEYPIDWI